MSQVHETASSSKSHKHDGVSPHLLSYIVSILLTILAFAAVIIGVLDTVFVMFFIVALAIVQAAFQMIYWMHMKDKGHLMPIVFILGGVIIIVPVMITALFWMWGY